jgi:hypothetical protein
MTTPPQNRCKFQTQWEGTGNNFVVLLNIYSRWQARIGDFNIAESTDANARRISGTDGKVLTYAQAVTIPQIRQAMSNFNVNESNYLYPLQGDLLYPSGVKE